MRGAPRDAHNWDDADIIISGGILAACTIATIILIWSILL